MILKTSGNREGRTCPICGKHFLPKTISSYYCSRTCQNAAYRKKKREREQQEELRKFITSIPKSRAYISVPEALHIYNVKRRTLYRWIEQGRIPGTIREKRNIRLDANVMSQLFPRRLEEGNDSSNKHLYDMSKENCYTIGEIAKKYHIHEDTVSAHIRRFSIPTRQIGNYVYAPKSEIDKIYKSL